MERPIVNIDELEMMDFGHDERFQARMGRIGPVLGARKLGYNVTVVPPGRRAFPRHNHRVNEEMFFILEGSGELRVGDDTWPVRAGDVIACPPGGPETAHQLVNTSDSGDLRYLAVSTKESPEICDYPDSGKFAVMAEWPGESERWVHVNRKENGLDYWDGE